MTWEHEFMRVCRSAVVESGLGNAEDGFTKKAASTEAAQFFQAGYDALAFGPGSGSGNSHGPNEHIELDQLERAVRFYEKVIEKTCL
jgi:acetylornithine deacetylase/succinyl-diaminopimelate desuccinylase-like protein